MPPFAFGRRACGRGSQLMMTHSLESGDDAASAAVRAGAGRFRPIVLAALTSFFGLAPMIFETSISARFLIPTALSPGFGILFSTPIILIITPALYVINSDLGKVFRFIAGRLPRDPG